MSDYEYLMALMKEYTDELEHRKVGDTVENWKGEIETYTPRNKERLKRLRLEISRTMLQIENKCVNYIYHNKEDWY